MKIYTDLSEIKHPFTKPFVTIGNFDGVHLGHQILFSEVVNKAFVAKGTSVAITFAPHPLQVIRPDFGIKLISTCEQKRELIALAGIDVLVIIPFTKGFAGMPAATFVGWVVGYLLDKWLHTTWLYLLGLLLGIAAGFVELVRTVMRSESKQ